MFRILFISLFMMFTINTVHSSLSTVDLNPYNKKSLTPGNKILERLNEYLPGDLRSTDVGKAIDNFVWYVAEILNGELGEKEDLLLFGDYTDHGRDGGLFDKIKSSSNFGLVAFLGALSYNSGLCENRSVLQSVLDGFNMVGIISNSGRISKEKLEVAAIEKRINVVLSLVVAQKYRSGVEGLIRK